MQRLEVSGAVRLIYKSLGIKGLNHVFLAVCSMVRSLDWIFFSNCTSNMQSTLLFAMLRYVLLKGAEIFDSRGHLVQFHL